LHRFYWLWPLKTSIMEFNSNWLSASPVPSSSQLLLHPPEPK
jgi:hypothetical protein